MDFRKLPAQIVLKRLFIYQEGILFWRTSRKKAGYTRTDGRIIIGVNTKPFMAHRLIFKYHYGYDPIEIDHINRNPLNNRIENLREVSRSTNCYNTNLRNTNRSGIKGVCYDKSRKKWLATITHNYKTIFLGRYNCIGKAIIRRKESESIYIDSLSMNTPNQTNTYQ